MADAVDDLIGELITALVGLLPSGDVDARPKDEFLADLRSALAQAPDLLHLARGEAYMLGAAEAGVDTLDEERIYEDEDDLEAWWSEQADKLVLLVEEGDVDHQVVRARAESLLKREATTQLSAAQDQGLADAAEQLGWDSIFVPERDACLWCTSFAGSIAKAGAEEFDVVRNFTTDNLGPVTIPVHPWCRCKRKVVHPDDARMVATPLKREAERAVLRFEALPSESDRARTEAAARLLAAGTALPKTVIERSERAVRRRREAEGPARKKRTKSP